MSKLINRLYAEKFQAETQIKELRQMAKQWPISRTVSLIEINNRIAELEEFLSDTVQAINEIEKNNLSHQTEG